MIISIPGHDYYVIQKFYENNYLDVLLCSELTKENEAPAQQIGSSGAKYRIIRIMDKKLIYELLPFFAEQKSNTAFTDYCGCFSKDGFLNLVFTHSDYTGLFDKLKNELCPLRERIEIGKKLLEHIIMQNVPDFILYDALAADNVTVSNALDIKFNYRLESALQHASIGIDDVRDRLKIIYERLFDYEIQRMASAEIDDFLNDLGKTRFGNYFEIYKRYEQLYDKLLAGELAAAVRPNTFLFRLWARIKRLIKYVRPAISFVLMALMVAYLLYTILHREVDAAKVFNYQQIGTVEIIEGNNETENASE